MGQESEDPTLQLAQRASDKAELEMIIIRESMTRVNEALAKTTLSRSPKSLLKLSRTLRMERKIQEDAAAHAAEIVTELHGFSAQIASSHARNLTSLKESIEFRASDLGESLMAREAGMSAALQTPRRWMKTVRKNRAFEEIVRIKIMETLWKVDVFVAIVLLILPFDGWPPTASNMLASGLMFLLSGLTATAVHSLPRQPQIRHPSGA